MTVDGFTIGGYNQGVWSTPSTSGLQVLNTYFGNVGNSVIPDSDGEQETAIRNNTFRNIASDRGASQGRLVVADNVFTGKGALLGHFGVRGRDVTVQGNRASDSGTLARLESVDGAVIEGNVVDGAASSALAGLFDTRDVAVRSNVVTGDATFGVLLGDGGAGNRDPVIEANDFSGSGQLQAIRATPDSVDGTLVVRYNRFATGVRGLVAYGPSSVDARYNWWGCNAGPNQPDCATLERYQGTSVRTVPQLTLSIETASNRIVNASGGTTTFRASLLRDSDGTVHQPARFPHISFTVSAASGSRVADLVQLHPGVVSGTLVADGRGVDLEALVDGAEVRTHVDYGPAPGPAAMPAPLPGGPPPRRPRTPARRRRGSCRASSPARHTGRAVPAGSRRRSTASAGGSPWAASGSPAAR